MFGEQPHSPKSSQHGAQPKGGTYFAAHSIGRDISKLQRATSLFAGLFGQLGFAYLILGGGTLWMILPSIDWSSITRRGAEMQTATGTVQEVKKTNVSSGSDGTSKTPVYANHFTFSVQEETHRGVSYSVGRTVEPGDSVALDYVVSDPSDSTISGMRANKLPPLMLLILIFPLSGLGMVVVAVKQGRKRAHLLQYGTLVTGRFVRKESTLWQLGGRRMYRYVFEFTDANGAKHQTSGTTYQNFFQGKTGEQTEVLYDPLNPQNAAVTKTLPGGLGVTADTITVSAAAPVQLLLPALALLTNLGLLFVLL